MIENTNSYDRTVERRRARTSIFAIAAVVFVAFALVAGAKAYHTGLSGTLGVAPDAALTAPAPLPASNAAAGAEALSQAFATVAKALGPAVVHINIVQEVPRQSMLHSFGFNMPEDGGGTTKERGSGSGVVVNANGFILTNNHVVGKA